MVWHENIEVAPDLKRNLRPFHTYFFQSQLFGLNLFIYLFLDFHTHPQKNFQNLKKEKMCCSCPLGEEKSKHLLEIWSSNIIKSQLKKTQKIPTIDIFGENKREDMRGLESNATCKKTAVYNI